MRIFEYMDHEVVVASIMIVIAGLLFIGSRSKKTTNVATSIKLLLVIAFLLPFVSSLYNMAISNQNAERFKNDKELECANDKSRFFVSKSSEWILKDDNFIKDSLMIRANQCKLYER